MRLLFDSWIADLPVTRKIQLIFYPAALALVCLVILQISNQREAATQAEQTASIVGIATILDGVAHNHAVERGLTAGFLGSKGQAGAEKLKAQRKVA